MDRQGRRVYLGEVVERKMDRLGRRQLSGRTEDNRIDRPGRQEDRPRCREYSGEIEDCRHAMYEQTGRQSERRDSGDFHQSYDLHTMQGDSRRQRIEQDQNFHQKQRYSPSTCSRQERTKGQNEWHDRRERQIDLRERLGGGTAFEESDHRGSSKSDRRDTASRQDDVSNRSTEGRSANGDTSERNRNEKRKRKSKHDVSKKNSESKKRKKSRGSDEKKHTRTATKENSDAEEGELMEDKSEARCRSPESVQGSVEGNKNYIAEVMKVIVQGARDLTMTIGKLFYLLQSQNKCFGKSKKDLSEDLRRFPQCFIVNGDNVTAKTTIKCCEEQNCSCSNLHFCKYHLLNQCTYNRCKFNHEIKSDANMSVLRNHHLHLMRFREIQKIVTAKDSRNVSTLPTVCKFYNNAGDCKKYAKCDRLNVCLNYVTGDCKFGLRCNRCHDLRAAQPKTVLERYGLFVDQIRDFEKLRLQIMSTLDENGKIVHKNKKAPTTNPIGTMPVITNKSLTQRYFSNNIRDANSVQCVLPTKISDRKEIKAETDSKEREPIHIRKGLYTNVQLLDNNETLKIDQIAKKETDRQSDANAAFDQETEYNKNDENLPSTNNDKRNNIDDSVDIPTLLIKQEVKIEQTSDTPDDEIKRVPMFDAHTNEIHQQTNEDPATSPRGTILPEQLPRESTGKIERVEDGGGVQKPKESHENENVTTELHGQGTAKSEYEDRVKESVNVEIIIKKEEVPLILDQEQKNLTTKHSSPTCIQAPEDTMHTNESPNGDKLQDNEASNCSMKDNGVLNNREQNETMHITHIEQEVNTENESMLVDESEKEEHVAGTNGEGAATGHCFVGVSVDICDEEHQSSDVIEEKVTMATQTSDTSSEGTEQNAITGETLQQNKNHGSLIGAVEICEKFATDNTIQPKSQTMKKYKIKDDDREDQLFAKKDNTEPSIHGNVDKVDEVQIWMLPRVQQNITWDSSINNATLAVAHNSEEKRDLHICSTESDEKIVDEEHDDDVVMSSEDKQQAEQLSSVKNDCGENKDFDESVMTFNNERNKDQPHQMVDVGVKDCDTDVGEPDINGAMHQMKPQRSWCTVGSIDSMAQPAKMECQDGPQQFSFARADDRWMLIGQNNNDDARRIYDVTQSNEIEHHFQSLLRLYSQKQVA